MTVVSWSKYPLARICLPFVAGILTGILAGAYINIYFLLALWIATLVVHFLNTSASRISVRREYFLSAMLLANMFCIGNVMTYYSIDEHFDDDFIHHLSESNYLIVRVTEPPVPRPNSLLVYCDVKYCIAGTEASACCGKTLLYAKRNSSKDTIRYGDYLVVKNSFQPVQGPQNPDAPDFKALLHWKNIDATCFLDNNQWRKLSLTEQNPVYRFIYSLRSSCIAAIQKNIPAVREASVAESLLFGYRHDVTAELSSAYASAGVIHILAVAGLHVGFIALLLQSVVKIIRRKKKKSSLFEVIFVLSGIALFAMLSGLSGSVIRASVMFSLLTIGKYSNRSMHPVNLVAATLLLILVFNPLLIMDVGLQLSLAAITGIRVLYPFFSGFLEVSNKIMDFVWKTICISISAQLGTLPLTLHYFNQFPVYFLLANILVIPLAGLILYVEVVFEVFHAVPYLSAWLAKVLQGLLWFMNEYIFQIQQMPLSTVKIGTFDWFNVLLLALGLGGILHFILYRRKIGMIIGLTCLLIGSVRYAFDFFSKAGQNQLVIFRLSHSSGMEFNQGFDSYFFYASPPDSNDLQMIEHHRQMQRMCVRDSFFLPAIPNSAISFPFSNHSSNIHRAPDSFRLVCIDRPLTSDDSEQKVKVSAILISNNARLNAKSLFSAYDPELIIVDGSDSKRSIRYWKNEAAKRNISFYNTNESGAFIKPL